VLAEGLLALEGSALNALLRSSLWLYPLANIVHVLGVATLFGAILVTDLRLLGRGRALAVAPLLRLTLPLAWMGFALAALSGVLLFASDPRVFARNPFFLAKLVLLAAAGLNAWLFHRLDAATSGGAALPALSLGTWVAVLICGRAIAYW
jgi:hypothetical protein